MTWELLIQLRMVKSKQPSMLELDISEHHHGMLSELRDYHEDEIDNHLQTVVEAQIHETYQQMREADTTQP